MKLKTFRSRFSLLVLFIVLLSFGSILAEPDFYDLQMPEYNSEHHVPMYRDRYYLHSFDQWNSSVVDYMTQMKTSWEAKADETIWSILNSIQSSDYFIDKEGYIDETFRSLETQKIRMMVEWELNANIDYYENQNIFIEKLNTGRLDQLFLDRIYDTQYFKSLSEHERGMYLEQQRFVDSVKHWENELNLVETKGLNDFSKAFTDLQSEYESYLNQIESTDTQFIENLGAINEYKNQVKQGIHSLIGYFQENLAEECMFASGCQYRAGNQNLNEAGILMSSFIKRISEQLTDTSIHPNFLLTEITKEIGAFLSEQQIKAKQESVFYSHQIYTYQNGLNVNLSNSVSTFDVEQAINGILHGNIDSVSSDQIYGNWEGPKEDAHLFNHVQDSYLQSVFRAIYKGDDSLLKSEIQSRLGNNRQVKEILYSNLYTHHQDYLNNLKILGFAVPFFHSSHDYGNLKLDGKENYGHWTAVRNLTEYTHNNGYYLMGKVGYGVLYKMYDKNSDDTFQYWDSNQGDLLGQFRMFEDNLRPSVFNWESKVVSYSNQYEDWKSESEKLKEKAHEEFISKWTELESKKEEWLHNLAEEKKRGKEEWIGLYTTGQLSETVNLTEKMNPISLESSFKNLNLEPLKFYAEISQSGPDSHELEFGGKSFFNQLRMSFIGFDQYGSLLQSNQDISDFQKKEQQKLINQVTYAIHWKNRAIASFGEDGNIVGENNVYSELLKKFSESMTKNDCKAGDANSNCFEVQFKDQLEYLKKNNLEYVSGMIVNRLSETDKQNINSCYENINGSNCSAYLIKEFDSKLDSNSNILTVSKKINDGTIQGKNEKGIYKNGVIEEVRFVHLSTNTPLMAPDKKSFFEEWTNEDWKTLNDGKNLAFEKVIKSLDTDLSLLSSQTNDIRKEESRNELFFLRNKRNQEKADSIFQELALSYLTGGMAGVKASIKNQVESAINSELATAWIRATGGSEDDIALATQAVQFMRGRLEIKNINSKGNSISMKNPIQSMNDFAQKQVGNAVAFGDRITGGALTMVGTVLLAPTVIFAKAALGEKAVDQKISNATARTSKIKEIKAAEVGMAKAGAKKAIAAASGLPPDLVSHLLDDELGKRAAAKVKKNMNAYPSLNMWSQIAGVVGGLVKTVYVAAGVSEADFQKALSQTSSLINAGNYNQGAVTEAGLGLAQQVYGSKATAASYQSAMIDIRDQKAVVEELGKQALAREVANTLGIDPGIARGMVDHGYGEYSRRNAEKKAQNAAIEQVAVMAATTAVTMGAGAALNAMVASANSTISAIGSAVANFGNTVGNAVGSFLGSSAQATTTMVTNATTGALEVSRTAITTISSMANATVQGVYGSRNGIEGALAGIANGLLGGATHLAGPIESGMLVGVTPGLGVTYHPENGWGGSIGIGNTVQNASIGFSQRGDSTLSVSQNLGSGVQFSADVTTNGQQNFGFNYNPSEQGPRSDWNLSLMYDAAGSGLSASLGYTDPRSTFGLTSTFNRDGLSTSAELTGVSIATNGPNGFQMDEINFAQQNINAAQDKTQQDQNSNQATQSQTNTEPDSFLEKLNTMYNGAIASLGSLVGTGMGTVLDLALGVGGLTVGGIGLMAGMAGAPGMGGSVNYLPTWLRRPEDEGLGLIDQITGAIDRGWNATTDAVLSGISSIGNGLSWVGDRVGSAYEAVTGVLETGWDTVTGLFGGECGSDTANQGVGQATIPVSEGTFGGDNGVGRELTFKERILLLLGGGTTNFVPPDAKPGEKIYPGDEPQSDDYKLFRKQLLDRFFGLDGKSEPAKKFVEKLLENSNLSDFDKQYLRESINAMYLPTKDYNKLKEAYMNGTIPDNFHPPVRFAPLVPGVGNLQFPDTSDSIPSGGRERVFENGVVVRQWDITLDRDTLVNQLDAMNAHATSSHGVNNSPMTVENGIGNNANVNVQIPEKLKDNNGNVLLGSYSYDKDSPDYLNRFTNTETATFLVNAATKWFNFQSANGVGTTQPIRANDLNMPGNGVSPFADGHHSTVSSIDIAIPGLDGNRADTFNGTDKNGKLYSNSNYDRQKTIDLIKILAESVPPGKSLQVFFNDPEVIDYFRGTNIQVQHVNGHANHLHVQMR